MNSDVYYHFMSTLAPGELSKNEHVREPQLEALSCGSNPLGRKTLVIYRMRVLGEE